MIDVTNLTRRYGNFTAVDRVSFHIDRGEVVGLLGHNGAGKTTIMKMLTGFLEPSEGEIRIAGQDLSADLRRARARIGYLPENCPLYLEMSVVDFLDYTATLRGIPASVRPEAIRNAVHRTDLREKALAPIATLSRGYRQRVGVAQALLHRPEILILDEPTNGLDPGQIGHMRELIRELGQTSTVIVSTHILQEVEATCDRVLILRNGKLARDARLAELIDGSELVLRCDAEPSSALCLLNALETVVAARLGGQGEGVFAYRLQVAGEREAAAAAIAEAVIREGWRLFGLQTEDRSLEQVFHDITAGEVTTDAA